MRTARAKGLSPRIVDRRHVLRNALLPVVDDHRAADRAAALGRGPDRDRVRVSGIGTWLAGGDLQPRLSRAPGRDPLPRDRLRPRQPRRRHLVRLLNPRIRLAGRQSSPSSRSQSSRSSRTRRAACGARRGAGCGATRARSSAPSIVGIFVVFAIFAPLLAPHDPREQNLFADRRTAAARARRRAAPLGVDHSAATSSRGSSTARGSRC